MHTCTVHTILTALILFLSGFFPCTAQSGADDPLCVANLRAEACATGGVRLSWSLPEGPSKGNVLFYAIYRDLRPIYSSTRIKTLYPIAAVPKSHIAYIDETDDGKPYYYAVLTFVDGKEVAEDYRDLYYDEVLDGPDGENRVEEDSGMLYAVILPGINATISPIKAAAAASPTATPASPLYETDRLHQADRPPQAGMAQKQDSIREAERLRDAAFLREEEETLNKERSIRPETERKAADLHYPRTTSGRKAVPLFRHIFSEDQVLPVGGDDYLLYKILQDTWLAYRYREAKAELTAFLAQRRESRATERATFYLAEAEYFTGNYVEALNLFVTVQDSFPQVAGKWIDSCLDLL